MMIKNTMATVRAETWQLSSSIFKLNEPVNIARSRAPKAPTAPASLGVAQPSRIEHLIMPIRNTGGKKAFQRSGIIWPLGTARRSGGNGGGSFGQIVANRAMKRR